MAVGPNKRIKAPKVFQGQPGGKGKTMRSSTRKPSPTGTDPSNPSWGINGRSRFPNVDAAAARASKLLGNGSANSSNQGQLARKAKRQVG